jgi:hypothetical protein
MKLLLTISGCLISLLVFSQKNVQRVTSFAALTHASIKKGNSYLLKGDEYGGGLFEAKEKANYVIDSGIVFPTRDSNIVFVRKMDDARTVKIEWFNVRDSIHNFMPAFKKAAAYLTSRGGGTIIFPAGVFYADPYFAIDANNISVKGAGKNKTFIKVSANAGAGLMVNSNYRDAGWLLNPQDMITYKENSVQSGSNYIDLKIASDISKLKPGTIIFINAGANYFDQHYGEFNMVDHCTASGRLYLKYNLSRSYTQAVSSWTAALTQDFTPPAEGGTAAMYFNGTQPGGGIAISIGNDLYKVISSTPTSAVVMNVPDKGNASAIMPAGTHIFRYRAIALTPAVVYNTSVQNMTITGRRKALIVSNTFKTYFKNCVFNWQPQPLSPGGVWIDGDDGRDFTMTDCEINCAYLFSSQFARSFADIYIYNTTFNQAGLQFTEFNINANVSNCTFHLSYNNAPGESENQPVIILGNTCNAINFNNNTIYASNIRNVFNSGEIQGSKAVISSIVNINNNTIYCNNVGILFSGSYSGPVYVQNNKVGGSVNYLFNVRSRTVMAVIKNNVFNGYIDGFGSAAGNIQYVHNTITRKGPAHAPVEYNAWGNVLYTHFTKDTTIQNFICKDNIFYNWNLLHNSFSHYWPLSKQVEISNNKFYASPKDTIVAIHTY